MKRFAASAICIGLFLALNHGVLAAEGNGGFTSGTGNLLRGTVYKQNGMERSGAVTIRMDWVLPAAPPVFRYDFDILNGTIEGNLYNYLMADIAEMEFLPLEDGRQPVNIKLRNGLMQKALLTSKDMGVIGKVKLRIKEVDVITDKFGEEIIPGGDVQKIVFSAPPAAPDVDMPGLVFNLKRALDAGKRDELIDKDMLIILQKIQRGMEEKLNK